MDVLNDSQFLLLASYMSSRIDPNFPSIGCSSCGSNRSLYSLENDYICSDSVFSSSSAIAGCKTFVYLDDGDIKCSECDSGFIITKAKDRCLQAVDIQWGGSTSLLSNNSQYEI